MPKEATAGMRLINRLRFFYGGLDAASYLCGSCSAEAPRQP
jgi:hypothetical protein